MRFDTTRLTGPVPIVDVMSARLVQVEPGATVREAARHMTEEGVGSVAICDGSRLVGIFTERDVLRRVVAVQRDPATTAVQEVMTTPVLTATPETPLEECRRVLEENRIRRVPVVDASGACCGIVALADIALHARKRETAEVVREVSEPSSSASAAG